MDKRRLGLGLLFFILPLTAHADRHKIGFRGAITDAKRSSLKGGQFSIEFPVARKGAKPPCGCCTLPLPDCCGGKQAPPECCVKEPSPDCSKGGTGEASHPKEKRTLSAVLEGSFVTGEHEGEDLDQATYLSGLRYSFNHPGQERVHLYLQGLVGGSHDSRGEIRDRPLVVGSLGLHYRANDRWGVSLQVDRSVLLAGSKEWYTSISLGLVLRLEP